MAGYGVDTTHLTIRVTLPDGSKVEALGYDDGVNGLTWEAYHVTKDDTTACPVEIERTVLVDGITEADDDAG